MSPSSIKMSVEEGLSIDFFHSRMKRAAGEKRDLATAGIGGRSKRPGHRAMSDLLVSMGFSPATSWALP